MNDLIQILFQIHAAIASSSLDSGLCFWDADTGHLLNQIALGPVDLWTVAFSPCNKYVISGSHEGKISFYNVETGKPEQVLDPQNGKFTLSIAYVSLISSLIRLIIMKLSDPYRYLIESRWEIHR